MSPTLLSGAARLAGSSLLRLQSDDRLVALVRDGHDPAFTALVERYRPELQRYCARLVGEDRAEDVVQQAFLNAHGAMRSSDVDIQLRPWLYRITHNAGLNVLRAARSEDELDERMSAAGADVPESAEIHERLHDALSAISRLPQPQRDALTLRAVEGRSHAEIAAALGVSAGAARQHLHRARVTVRAAVSAVTPYGLIARFAMAGGGDPAAAAIASGAGASATAGLGLTVTKIGAGVLAAGAIATGTTGHVPFLGSGHRAAATPEQAKATAGRGVPETHGAGAATPVSAASPAATGGRPGTAVHGPRHHSTASGAGNHGNAATGAGGGSGSDHGSQGSGASGGDGSGDHRISGGGNHRGSGESDSSGGSGGSSEGADSSRPRPSVGSSLPGAISPHHESGGDGSSGSGSGSSGSGSSGSGDSPETQDAPEHQDPPETPEAPKTQETHTPDSQSPDG